MPDITIEFTFDGKSTDSLEKSIREEIKKIEGGDSSKIKVEFVPDAKKVDDELQKIAKDFKKTLDISGLSDSLRQIQRDAAKQAQSEGKAKRDAIKTAQYERKETAKVSNAIAREATRTIEEGKREQAKTERERLKTEQQRYKTDASSPAAKAAAAAQKQIDKDRVSALREIKKLESEISKTTDKYSGGNKNIYGEKLEQLAKLQSELEDARNSITGKGTALNAGDLSAASAEITRIQSNIASLKAELKDLAAAEKDSFIGNPAAKTKAVKETLKVYDDIQKKMKEFSSAEKSSNEESAKAYEDLAKNSEKALSLIDNIKNGKISRSEAANELLDLITSTKQYGDVLDRTTPKNKSFGDSFKGLVSNLNNLIPLARIASAAIKTFRQMIDEAIKVNDAMTQMQIVTKASDKQMAEYGQQMFDIAKRSGVSATDIISAATTYARLGYTPQESQMFAELTTMLQKVGDIKAEDAQSAMTSIVKAFDVDSNGIRTVMDKLIAVGNGAPISVAQIAEAMTNASATMAAAGNDIDKTIALMTAANTTLQNSARSSTGLRTITARIRKTKTELDELGETISDSDYEGIVQALSKITLQDGTTASVSLTDARGEYRATYDILSDLAKLWNDLDSMSQSGIVEKLAGTRMQDVFYSLMNNWDEAEKAIELMNGASDGVGALQDAYNVYLQSTTSSLETFKSAFAELSSDLMRPELMNPIIDFGTWLLEVLDVSAEKIGDIAGYINDITKTPEERVNDVLGRTNELLNEQKEIREQIDEIEDAGGPKSDQERENLIDLQRQESINKIKLEQANADEKLWRRRNAQDAYLDFISKDKNGNTTIEAFEIAKRGVEEYTKELDGLIAEYDLIDENDPLRKEKVANVNSRIDEARKMLSYATSMYNEAKTALEGMLQDAEGSGLDANEKSGLSGLVNNMIQVIKDTLGIGESTAAVASGTSQTPPARKYATDRDLQVIAIHNAKRRGEDTSDLERGLEVIDLYNAAANSRGIKDLFKTLRDSDEFKSTWNSLEKIANTSEGITADKVRDLALDYDDLNSILGTTGMSAEFLANVMQHEAKEAGSGLSLITEKALALNQALTGSRELFSGVSEAINKYNVAVGAGEVDSNYKSINAAYDTLKAEIEAGRQGNVFWSAAELLYGTDRLEQWGYDAAKVISGLPSLDAIFGDADKGGQEFLDTLVSMADEEGRIVDKFGNEIANVRKTIGADGKSTYNYSFDMNQIDALADAFGVSTDAVLANMQALDLWGNASFYDVQNVIDVMKEFGLASDTAGGLAINANNFNSALNDIGLNGKTIYDVKNALADMGAVFFDVNADAKTLSDQFVQMGVAQKVVTDAGEQLQIDADAYGKVIQSLGLTMEQANSLTQKMSESGNLKWMSNGEEVTTPEFEDQVTTIKFDTDVDSSSYDAFAGNIKTEYTIHFKTKADPAPNYSGVTGGKAGANGNAFASGGIGAKDSDEALGGELGQELVVRGNRYFTVGDRGAEFFRYRKGDIVFNAEQTKQLLKNGSISRGRTRGTAFAHGYDAGGGDTMLGITASAKKLVAGAAKKYVKKVSDVVEDINKITGNATFGSLFNSGSGSSGGGGGGSSATDKDEEKLEKIDWIERAVKKLEREIDKLEKIANSAFKTLADKMSSTGDEITKVTSEISLQQQAYNRYMQEAESVALDSGLKQLVRDGTVDIQSYNEETRKLISEYQKWYDNAMAASDAVDNLHESIGKLYQDRFNNINDDFENQLSLIEHRANSYNSALNAMEAAGYRQSSVYYKQLSDLTRGNIGIMQRQAEALEQSLNEALASGEIKEYSDAWYDMKNAILDVRDSIDDANASLIEYANTIREIQWGYFDLARSRMEDINSEAEFLINLMSDSDLFNDNGSMNGAGTATLGLRAQNYNVDMKQADSYAREIIRLDKEIANDPYNTILIERRKELVEAQRESILAAQQEKESIRDLVREGFDAQLSSLKNLIDEYNDAMDSAKDLYDYTNKISDSTSNISNLQKQIAAYSGDTSEAATMRVQKLQTDLNKAQKDLQDQEYNRYISEQKKLLDDMYSDYEEALNNRLDNIDSLIAEVIDTVNANASVIRDTLISVSEGVGYTMADDVNKIWSGSTPANGVVSVYDQDFNYKLTAITQALTSIEQYVADAQQNSNVIAATGVRAYARGGLVDFTGLAKLDGSVTNPEIVLNPQDSANFISLRDMMRRMSGTDISALSSGSILSGISATAGMYSMMNAIRSTGQGTDGYRDIQINIPIDHVSDYNDFVSQLRDDPQFESMMLDMTVNKLSGGSNIAKNRYKW